MAMQIQNVLKSSMKLAGVRSLSSGSGILGGGDQPNNSEYFCKFDFLKTGSNSPGSLQISSKTEFRVNFLTDF
jgi:hypothetical protein